MNFPENCPYCGNRNRPNLIASNQSTCSNGRGYCVEVHQCVICDEPIFICKEELRLDGHTKTDKILHYYPINAQVEYPVRVKVLSPDACEIFEQTMQAKDYGLDRLVGAGIRMALERLMRDYLLTVKQMPENELEKLKSLKDRIDRLDDIIYMNNCATLIRIFGNDEIHNIKKYDFSIDEAINAYRTLCMLMESELRSLQWANACRLSKRLNNANSLHAPRTVQDLSLRKATRHPPIQFANRFESPQKEVATLLPFFVPALPRVKDCNKTVTVSAPRATLQF